VVGDGFDTILTVPDENGAAAFMVELTLDVATPDLSGLDPLLENRTLDHLALVLRRVDQPYPWAAEHLLHAFDHLRAGDFRQAWPPLVTGVEGLWWAVAEASGYLNDQDRFTAKASRSGKPTNVIDIILTLPINDRVQRFLKRDAFGGQGNAFRHGRLHEVGERQQCLLWLLTLVVWIDAYGWEWAYDAARAGP
jgi:hypothetical protein